MLSSSVQSKDTLHWHLSDECLPKHTRIRRESKYCGAHNTLHQSSTPSSASVLDLATDPDSLKLRHLNEQEVGSKCLDCQDVGDGCRKKSNVTHYLEKQLELQR